MWPKKDLKLIKCGPVKNVVTPDQIISIISNSVSADVTKNYFIQKNPILALRADNFVYQFTKMTVQLP